MKQTYYIKNEEQESFFVALADVGLFTDALEIESMVPPNWYYISRINVPHLHRGKGLGSKLLKMITDDADKEGIILFLSPVPTGGLDYDDLCEWYKRNGFDWDEERPIMVRRPHTSP